MTYEGTPSIAEYLRYTQSRDFREIEEFSDQFQAIAAPLLVSYKRRWVSDPLHQWSRQWEYPYIIHQARNLEGENLRALDLGSGFTFLPYYHLKKTGISRIVALDYDPSLGPLFESVNRSTGEEVEFSCEDIREIGDLEEKYDFIYSVSVLEHTDNYAEIIRNCHDLLKPGGKFSITFDVSLDGNDDIPVPAARQLLACLGSIFSVDGDLGELLEFEDGIVTSSYVARNIDRNLLPWRYPVINVIKPFITRGRLGSKYKQLTFCCLTVRKPQ